MSLRTTDPDDPGAFARFTTNSGSARASLRARCNAGFEPICTIPAHWCSLSVSAELDIEATRMNARTEHDPLEIVSTESLERELNLVRGVAAGSLAGVIGPRSIT